MNERTLVLTFSLGYCEPWRLTTEELTGGNVQSATVRSSYWKMILSNVLIVAIHRSNTRSKRNQLKTLQVGETLC